MTLKAGFSRVEVTPELSLAGSYRYSFDRRARGVHDPLFARWMVLERGGVRWALLSIDTILLATPQAEAWRRSLAAASGLAYEAITLACTHTHNGPDLPDELGTADPSLSRETFSRIRTALMEALHRLQPARLAWVEAQEANAINRHERSAGRGDTPVDPALSLLLVVSQHGEPLGHLVHYAAHPTTAKAVGCLISADYPGVLLRETQRALGGIGLFILGAAGNLSLEIGERSYERAEAHGTRLALACLKAAPSACLDAEAELRVGAHALCAAYRADLPSSQELRSRIGVLEAERARFLNEHPGADLPAAIWNRLRVLEISARLEREAAANRSVVLPFQWVTLAGRTCLFAPGEWFVEYALGLRRDLPERRPLWVNCANGYCGYLPTETTHAEPGTYVNQPGALNRLAPGTGERLYGEIVRRLMADG